MSRYLVTGAAGFIGSHVCRLLLDQGHEVTGVDSLNDAYDPRLKSWRLEKLRASPGFRFEQCDIARGKEVAVCFSKTAPYDAVINLAARAGVRQSVEYPWPYVNTNVTGTLNLLVLCRQSGVPKFVLASTSSLYGAHNTVPYREDADTTRPLSPYAASKQAAESFAYAYHHLYKLDVSVLRYFTVYGPAGRPDMSVFRFVRRITEGEPIVVFGDGRQQRDFTYVDDIARGTVLALRPLGFEVINLGGDRPVELAAVIAKIEELVGRKATIERRPAHPADVAATWADISKAKRLLGWSPQCPVEEGLARCVEWYVQERAVMRTIELNE